MNGDIVMSLFKKIFQKNEEVSTPYNYEDRYAIEHVFMPNWILGSDGAGVICQILDEEGQFFVDTYNNYHRDDAKYSCPYTKEQFSVSKSRITGQDENDLFAVRIVMPQPERTPLCSLIFLLHDDKMESRRYLTIERDDNLTSGYAICEWDKNQDLSDWNARGMHAFYGNYSDDRLMQILRA